MIRLSLVVLGSAIALSLGFVPGTAQAAGDIQLECWDRTGQPSSITRPTFTVGCTFSWFPVPVAVGASNAMLEVDFECVEAGCQVFGNPGQVFFDITDPAAATVHSYIKVNCTGSAKIVAVVSRAFSWGKRHNVQFIRERLNSAAGGIVSPTLSAPECPFIGGTVGIG